MSIHENASLAHRCQPMAGRVTASSKESHKQQSALRALDGDLLATTVVARSQTEMNLLPAHCDGWKQRRPQKKGTLNCRTNPCDAPAYLPLLEQRATAASHKTSHTMTSIETTASGDPRLQQTDAGERNRSATEAASCNSSPPSVAAGFRARKKLRFPEAF